MTRTERVFDLLDRLKGTDTTTVARLADELAVSARTVHRDLATLRSRGLPITGEAGPGGGLRLEGNRGITAVNLSVAEVVTLWLAARLSQPSSALPWSGAAQSALSKLLASLPRARAAELRALCRRVIVGPPASAGTLAGAGKPPAALLQRLEEAFTAGQGLAFVYVDRQGRTTARTVEAHGLLVQPPVWYVLARDVAKGEPRMFRMDRISASRSVPAVRFTPDLAVLRALLPEAVTWSPLLGRLHSA